MVRHHVAKSTCFFVEARSVLNPKSFGCRNLHIVDMLAVPHRLKNRVTKAEHQDVLHGFFAEVVVDAVDVALVEHSTYPLVEFTRAFKVMAEGLFQDDS